MEKRVKEGRKGGRERGRKVSGLKTKRIVRRD